MHMCTQTRGESAQGQQAVDQSQATAFTPAAVRGPNRQRCCNLYVDIDIHMYVDIDIHIGIDGYANRCI